MKRRRNIAVSLAAGVLAACLLAVSVSAAAGDRYVSMGADLDPAQRAGVLELMGLSEEELAQCTVVEVTNEEEHRYLDEYIDPDVIGDTALSCVFVTQAQEGYGLHITTKNINYCTVNMYQSALATAGVKNAEIVVAAPASISGTAALVGAMKAYSSMTNQLVDPHLIEAAAAELVTTGEIGEVLDNPDQAADLIALIKARALSGNVEDENEIRKIIDECASELNITLTDAEKEDIFALIKMLASMDLDWSQILTQARDVYKGLEAQGFSFTEQDLQKFLDSIRGGVSQGGNFFEAIGNFFANIWNSIVSWFSGLFGGN